MVTCGDAGVEKVLHVTPCEDALNAVASSLERRFFPVAGFFPMALQGGLQALELALAFSDLAPQGLDLCPIERPIIGHQHRPLDAEDFLPCPVAPDRG